MTRTEWSRPTVSSTLRGPPGSFLAASPPSSPVAVVVVPPFPKCNSFERFSVKFWRQSPLQVHWLSHFRSERKGMPLYNVSVPKDSGRFECIPPHSFPLPPARRGMQGINVIFSPIHFLSPGAKCVHVQRRFQTEISSLLRGNPVSQKQNSCKSNVP